MPRGMYRVSWLSRVSVLGAGVMGHGIAQLAAMAGYEVRLLDIEPSILERALEKIRWSLMKLAEKNRYPEEAVEETLARIRTTTDIPEAVEGCGLVIEAVPEDIGLKRGLLREVEDYLQPEAIMASNTSTLPISELADATQRPDKVVGIHFFNPPQLMPLVEVIKGEKTSEETLEKAVEFAKSLGKEVVVCRQDIPGFIVNRILLPLLDEAAWTVKRGEAQPPEIDSALRYKLGLPLGPFELMDYTGIDVVYQAMKEIKKRDPRLLMLCPLIEEMYRRGWWGRKSGRGFYSYTTEARRPPKIPREVGEKVDPLWILAPAVNSAARLLRAGIIEREELEKAVRLGLGFPEGILSLAEKLGMDVVVKTLEAKAALYGDFYTPDEQLVEMSGRKREAVYEGTLTLKREPPIAWITLNRPKKLNALTQEMINELELLLGILETDKEIRVVALRGAGGKAFSAGADIEFLKNLSPEEAEKASRRWNNTFKLLEAFPKPIVAVIEGYCFGSGLELALACDLRVAREDSILGNPEIDLGLIPGAGGTQRLTKLVGLGKAKEMIMLGENIGAEEALRIGLVNKVYPREGFEEKVKQLLEKLAEKPPLALKAAKQAVNLAAEGRFEEGIRFEAKSFGKLMSTLDAREGIDAFLSKRKPRFRGE